MSEERIIRIEGKIDAVSERLGSIDATLSAQHVSLKEHMRRTAILETTIEPIKSHVAMVHGALKLIGVLATFAAIIEGVASILPYLRK